MSLKTRVKHVGLSECLGEQTWTGAEGWIVIPKSFIGRPQTLDRLCSMYLFGNGRSDKVQLTLVLAGLFKARRRVPETNSMPPQVWHVFWREPVELTS
jgi:hypothetical protein